MELIEKALKILEKSLCDHCLGRFYSGLLSGYTNDERGKFIRSVIAMMVDSKSVDYSKIEPSNLYGFNFRINKDFSPVKPEKCFLCNSLDGMALDCRDVKRRAWGRLCSQLRSRIA